MLNFLSVLSEFPGTGHAFIVSGKTTEDAQKFSVSLANGKAGNSDIALMLFVNFAEGEITRNSLVNGNWSESEIDENLTSHEKFPVKRDDDFTIYILVAEERFHVSINEKPFCTYNFKAPTKLIRAISVSGDVDSISQVDHRLVFPSVYPEVSNDTPDVVFTSYIPKKYKPGHIAVVSGVATGSSDSEFVIMFNENGSSRQLIHFNVRFYDQEVVMNTSHGSDDASWGDSEAKSQSFPFAMNQPFKIAFAFTNSEVKVAVLGYPFMSFAFDHFELEDGESLWDILTGFQVKAASDLDVKVTNVEHVQASNGDCDGFENYSALNAY